MNEFGTGSGPSQAHFETSTGEAGARGCSFYDFGELVEPKLAESSGALDRGLLRAIVENTPECIKIVALDGTLLKMNSAGRRMIEAGPSEAIEGASIFDIIAPEFREHWKARHLRVCNGESLAWEFDIVGFAGTRRHMETHAVPFEMPDGTLAQLAITRDVTKRKQHERKLAESEHRFRQLLQALPAAVYTTDNEGNLTFYNDAAVEFAGKTPELGQKWCVTWRLTYGDGKPMPHEDCPMATTLKDKRAVRDAEAIAERPDGTRRWFVPYPTPIMNSDGEMTGAINMLVDITQRKEAERQQKILIDELNHRVKNSLATVQSIVRQTAANAERVEDYRDMLEARVLAMSRAHDQLSRRQWASADLYEIASEGLAAYCNGGNVAMEGEPVAVPPRAALLLSMVVHELATNAAKYGALSTAEGRVDLRWRVAATGKGPVLYMEWDESGGPKVQPPKRRGFGTRFVENGIRLQCGGKSAIDFAPDGVHCAIELPLNAEDASS